MTGLAVGNGIVVGIDGSEACREALRWATRQAHALRTDVVAVHAWEPVGPRFAPYTPPRRVRRSPSNRRGPHICSPGRSATSSGRRWTVPCTPSWWRGRRRGSCCSRRVAPCCSRSGARPMTTTASPRQGQQPALACDRRRSPWSRFPACSGPRRRPSPPGRPSRPEAARRNSRQVPGNSIPTVRAQGERRACVAEARAKRSRNVEETSWMFWWDTRPLTARREALPSGWPPG
ncbi:universal stress protein [Streptomyces sp. NPDC050548]|uniref:universal stress protein n=1 Tax=Streptomyces sp. NPDC050548 TaxID=3365629 RepID=UPI0037AADCBF